MSLEMEVIEVDGVPKRFRILTYRRSSIFANSRAGGNRILKELEAALFLKSSFSKLKTNLALLFQAKPSSIPMTSLKFFKINSYPSTAS